MNGSAECEQAQRATAMEGTSSEERCALVGELLQVLEMVRQLDAHMAAQLGGGVPAGGGAEERCRELVATMRAAIDRSVHIATRSFCCQQRLPVFAQPESPPSGGGGGGDGSPHSAGSDQAGGDSRGRGSQCKKMKTLPKWKTQVRVSAVQDVTPLDDGLSWRKYGQKDILGAKYPRAYFRCTHRHTQGCQASKQVQRTDGDPLLFGVVYNGSHTCVQQAQAAGHYPSNSNQSTIAENSPPQPQPQPGMEQQTTTPPTFDSTVRPFQLASNNPAAGANDNVREMSSGGCPAAGKIAASAFMPTVEGQAKPDGVRDVPEVELASTTNSPMGDIDFVFPLDDEAADFLANTINYDF